MFVGPQHSNTDQSVIPFDNRYNTVSRIQRFHAQVVKYTFDNISLFFSPLGRHHQQFSNYRLMGSGGVPRRPGADRRAGSRSWCGRARGGSLGLGHGVLRRHTAPRSGLAPAAQLPKSGCAGCGTLGARSEGRRGSPVRDARGGQCGTPGRPGAATGGRRRWWLGWKRGAGVERGAAAGGS